MTPEREKIAAKIRALKAKTVENGCTEAEALAAAELIAKLLAQYNMTLDEADLRESPFDKTDYTQDDWVGEKLWVVASAIADLTGARYWASAPGKAHRVSFFGFAHEVEVAGYLLDICSHAITGATQEMLDQMGFKVESRQRRAARPFIDGMATRLAQRIRAMIPPKPVGTGLVVLHDELVVQAMKDAGHNIGTGAGKVDLDAFAGYQAGVSAAERVALNPGLAQSAPQAKQLR